MKKLRYLDGLRGIAAMIVVLHHLALMFCPELIKGGSEDGSLIRIISTTPLNLFFNGDFAVCFFFVLSGYVLSYKYVLTNDAHIVMGYAVKRYFRLIPLIASSVIFSVLCIKAGWIYTSQLADYTGADDWVRDLFKADPTVLELLQNIFYGLILIFTKLAQPVY